MNETAAITAEPGIEAAPLPVGPARRASGQSVWQARIATVLLMVFMVAGGLAVPSIWVRNQVLDTDRFVRTVSPLATDADIQEAVSLRVSTFVLAEMARSPLATSDDPDREILAATLSMATTAVVENVVRSVVASPQFAALWESIARVSHSGVEALLTGGRSDFFSTDSGQITFELSPVVAAVETQLNNRGVAVTLPDSQVHFILFESESLAEAQSAVRIIDELAIILPIVALVALAGYLFLARDRRGAVVTAALGMAIMMAVLLLLLAVGRWLYLRELGDSVDTGAAQSAFDILTHYLRRGIRVIGLLSLIVMAVAIITRSRHLSETGIGGTLDAFAGRHRSLVERWPVLTRIESEIAANQRAAMGLLAAAIVALLLIWDRLTIGWALVLLAIGALGFWLIGRAETVESDTVPAADQPVAQPAVTEASAGETSVRLADDIAPRLRRLAALRDQGLLTNDEFATARLAMLISATSEESR